MRIEAASLTDLDIRSHQNVPVAHQVKIQKIANDLPKIGAEVLSKTITHLGRVLDAYA